MFNKLDAKVFPKFMSDGNIRPTLAMAYYKDGYLVATNSFMVVRRLSPGIEMDIEHCPFKADVNAFYNDIIESSMVKDRVIIDTEDRLFQIIKMFKHVDRGTIAFNSVGILIDIEGLIINIPNIYDGIHGKYSIAYLYKILTAIPLKDISSVEIISIDNPSKPMLINIHTNVTYEFLLMPCR